MSTEAERRRRAEERRRTWTFRAVRGYEDPEPLGPFGLEGVCGAAEISIAAYWIAGQYAPLPRSEWPWRFVPDPK